MNSLVKYTKNSLARLDQANDTYSEIFKYIDNIILENLQQISKKYSGKMREVKFIDQVYKAEEWIKTQRAIDNKVNSSLNKVLNIYNSEINDLKALYPEASFQYSDVKQTFTEIEFLTKNYTDDALQQVLGVKGQAKAYARAIQTNLYVNSNQRIMQFLTQTVKSTPARYIKTELITAQDNMYNHLRTNFFKSIETTHIKKYIYAGVMDSKTRPLCSKIIGEIKTEIQWRNIDNGQNGNVWQNRGGYNCRHMLLLVPETMTEERAEFLKTAFERKI